VRPLRFQPWAEGVDLEIFGDSLEKKWTCEGIYIGRIPPNIDFQRKKGAKTPLWGHLIPAIKVRVSYKVRINYCA